MDDLKFLALNEVLYLHEESLRRFGGSSGIRNPGLVESAPASAEKKMDKAGLAAVLRRLAGENT